MKNGLPIWFLPDGEAVVLGLDRVSGYHEGSEFYDPQFRIWIAISGHERNGNSKSF